MFDEAKAGAFAYFGLEQQASIYGEIWKRD
jgi:hypothetical protein